MNILVACEGGWDKASCDRHRLNKEIGYINENVISLCPNCHRLAHQGKLEVFKNFSGK